MAAQQERERFAERLKELRSKARLTQYQLADKAQIDRTLITRYETAKTMPRPKAIEKLAAALNVPPSELDVTDHSYPTLDMFDMKLLQKYGVTVQQIRPDLYIFSLPGCPEIEMTLNDLDKLCEHCFSETNKVFTELIERYFVNLFVREAYTVYEKNNIADKNDNKAPAE